VPEKNIGQPHELVLVDRRTVAWMQALIMQKKNKKILNWGLDKGFVFAYKGQALAQ
jgi:hypothetical protein